MNTINWTIQAEYCLAATTTHEEVLDKLTAIMCTLHLTETTCKRLRQLLLETLQRRTERGPLSLRLLSNGLTDGGAAQSCGFFLIEKNAWEQESSSKRDRPCATAPDCMAAIELYLFQ